ncbi:MAG TPA: hypothetical protein VFF61_03560 [Microvirga sp.]|nr:hypothetical protein [Microvirga sp.]
MKSLDIGSLSAFMGCSEQLSLVEKDDRGKAGWMVPSSIECAL